MPFIFEQNNGIGILKFYGDLTSDSAHMVKKVFFVALSNADQLIVDIKDVSKIGDFFTDQIYLVKKISKRLKKKFTMVNFPAEIFEKIEAAKMSDENKEVEISQF